MALAAATLLVRIAEPAFLDTDAAQYLSTAVNAAAGEGLATDIVYYDQQYAAGTVPAPQTVFPPGLPLMLALIIATGVDPVLASLALGTLSLCLTGLVIYAFLAGMRVMRPLALIGTGIWLALGLAWLNVLEGRAEVPFTLASLGAVMLAATARRRTSWLVAAGLLCSAAILLRYQGVFLLAALGICSLIDAIRARPRSAATSIRYASALLVLPAMTVLALVVRNLELAASPAGGPVDTVSSGAAFPVVARHLYWAISDTAAMSLDGLASARVPEWVMVAGAALILGGILHGVLRRTADDARAEPDGTPGPRRAVAELCLVYAAVTLAALLYLGTTRADDYLQGRFLVPLAPMLVLLWIPALDRWLRVSRRQGRLLLASGILAVHAGLWTAQSGSFSATLDEWRDDRTLAVIEQALAAPYGDETLREYLGRSVSRNAPLFAEPAQPVWLALQRPLLGATPAGFSTRIWNDAAVQRLQRCYHARLILFLPSLFDAGKPQHANKRIFIDLASGRVPGYLRLMHRSAAAELYAIDAEPAGRSCPEARGPA